MEETKIIAAPELLSAEEQLKQLDEQRKELRGQVRDEREERLAQQAKMRELRDSQIEKDQEKLKQINGEIYKYNKLGKVAKGEYDVFEKINELINPGQKEEIKEAKVISSSAEWGNQNG